MPAGYAPLPNPRSEPDAERELEEAFDEDDDHHTESTPLTHGYASSDSHPLQADNIRSEPTMPGSYDFERDYDYDYPPPGSPPSPSALALPNTIGNTNGRLPTAPVRPEPPRPSFFRRAVGVLLPQHYARLPSEPATSRLIGGGTDNDGVFANVMAKPVRNVAVTNDNGDVIMVPEDTQNELPPTYTEAQADSAPPYWETTVIAPASLSASGDMIVDDLPTGSLLFFIATAFVSYFFQFVGFVLTYLLHTSHAAKYGSRAGLGMTMIQYGFYSRQAREEEAEGGQGQELIMWNSTTGMPVVIKQSGAQAMLPNGTAVDVSPAEFGVTSRDWMSLLLMTLGWFLLLSSIVGFYRVKRWEKSIRDSASSPPPTAEQVQTDIETRRQFERAFSIFDYRGDEDENDERRAEGIPSQISEAEARLHRDLRAAGLL
ncbi:hypothetical protein IEO21_05543 [Rhodonia placenta]|uniref:Metal homeostatis protein bsd2 n=1 Tax=Rhodonia placenta TaxID=104341 RepID=A0A8H7U1I7_9APHY|nr:hypothetical protein IEO21_05543 [Postia placenta]